MLNAKLIHAACWLFIIQSGLSILFFGMAFLFGFIGTIAGGY